MYCADNTHSKGFDAVVTANIPGGGMSRSASLTLNLLLTTLEVNCKTVDEHSQVRPPSAQPACARSCGRLDPETPPRVWSSNDRARGAGGGQLVDLAVAVENDYIGSPCGNLDQIMILYAKAGYGTHYLPATREVPPPSTVHLHRTVFHTAMRKLRIVTVGFGAG